MSDLVMRVAQALLDSDRNYGHADETTTVVSYIEPAVAALDAILGKYRGPSLHKETPHYGAESITTPWDELPPEVQRGLELAAYIVRMYGDGDVWAEVILSRGEQIRALWWMEYEKRERGL